eukprot:CAMPEP_0170565752 /NCGR_PEP_ID=MMETSP0211-20121228/79391_1 /TAXON_ID=311385 /ORGANISM="Pseudokeronopsis sp., Strain OXSARD2" /LENGTH=169 /DNA_ID=CAMNT_0010886713 /DNA_START=1741 /DNA_END=2251 /DNA_ORIENTATION=-
MKFFTQVGYTQRKHKPIPRWCSNPDYFFKVLRHQKKYANADDIFGIVDPKDQQFNLREVFEGFKIMPGTRKAKKFDQRGSSANWDQNSVISAKLLQERTSQLVKGKAFDPRDVTNFTLQNDQTKHTNGGCGYGSISEISKVVTVDNLSQPQKVEKKGGGVSSRGLPQSG